jgi:hypothetical protein
MAGSDLNFLKGLRAGSDPGGWGVSVGENLELDPRRKIEI